MESGFPVARLLLALAAVGASTPAPAASAARQAPAAAEPARESEAAYRAALAAARDLSRQRAWKPAKEAWLALLREHPGAPYVQAELQEIRLQLRKASFWAGARAPVLDDLLAGDLLSYDPSTGWLKIAYRRPALTDFQAAQSVEPDTYRFPAHFKGPWSIELAGTREEVASATWLFGTHESGHGVRFGTHEPGDYEYFLHVLFAYDRGGSKQLATADPKPRKHKDKPVEAEVRIEARSLRASYDGAGVLQTAREGADFGQLVVVAPGSFGELTLAGKVDTGWLDGVLDAAVADQRRAFDAAWKDPPEVEAWKTEPADAPAETSADELISRLSFELRLDPQEDQLVEKFLDRFSTGREACLAALPLLDELRGTKFPAAALTYLDLCAAMALERHGTALERMAELTPSAGMEVRARLLRAVMLGRAKRGAEASAELEVLAKDAPDVAAVHLELVHSLLRQGRPADARAAIQRGRAALPASTALAELELQVVKADLGPPWKKVFEATGAHFTVRSDVSMKLCRDALRVLDKAMDRCVFELGAIPADRRRPSIAYLFAGKSSYLDYVHGIADDSAENTRGIYSLVLKQVVAWNQPDPERLWDTLRHECLHRYVDLRAGDVPRWFGEGLAETFAASMQADGAWKSGGLREEWIELLRAEPSAGPALEPFARQSEREFQQQIELKYALAWTWVHYLRFRDEESRAVFAALWQALVDGAEDSAAVDRALARRDPVALDRDYLKFLAELRGR